MGGRGSGRRPTFSGKDTTEASMPLDIRRLRRAGVLVPGTACGWAWTCNDSEFASIGIRAEASQVTLTYSYQPAGRQPEVVRQVIAIETTQCTLGGRRHWFLCPLCGGRVAVVYGAGRLFGCRRCKGLAYASQSEPADDRAARRADQVRKRLGWPVGFLNGDGAKPKGMHWRTFWRLKARHDALVMVSVEGMARRLGIVSSPQGLGRTGLAGLE